MKYSIVQAVAGVGLALIVTSVVAEAQGTRRAPGAVVQDSQSAPAPSAPTQPVEPAPPVLPDVTEAPGAEAPTGIPNFSASPGAAPSAQPPVAQAPSPLPTFNFTPPRPDSATPPPPQATGEVRAFNFGDDAGDYPNDGECDDRRFRGSIMATTLSMKQTGHDASDCRNGLTQGLLSLWILSESVAMTQCEALDYGVDEGEYANNDLCDDPRFEGIGMASLVRPDDMNIDATDCRRLCELGMIGLREY